MFTWAGRNLARISSAIDMHHEQEFSLRSILLNIIAQRFGLILTGIISWEICQKDIAWEAQGVGKYLINNLLTLHKDMARIGSGKSISSSILYWTLRGGGCLSCAGI
jgi:hypothetical protein